MYIKIGINMFFSNQEIWLDYDKLPLWLLKN